MNLEINIKNYSSIFHNINLKLSSNNFYVVSGENGVGKTTLLNIISRKIIDNNSINLKFNGITIDSKTENNYLDNLIYLPQEPLIFDDYTVFQNLSPFKNKNNISEITKILKILKLENTMFQNASTLSKGEKQRLSVARVLLEQKDIILLDEITTNLDEENKKIIFDCLKSIAKNKIIILVSHDKVEKFIENYKEIYLCPDLQFIENNFDEEKTNSTLAKKGTLLKDIKTSFKEQKSVFLTSSIIFSIFCFILLLFSTFIISFNEKSIEKLTYSTFLETSEISLLNKDTSINNFNNNEIYYLENGGIDLIEGIKPSNPGSYFSGVFALKTDEDFSLKGINIFNENDKPLGRLPINNNECLISSLHYEYLKTSENFTITNVFDKKIVGVYEAKLNPALKPRLKYADSNFLNYNIRISYGFMSESVFTINKDINTTKNYSKIGVLNNANTIKYINNSNLLINNSFESLDRFSPILVDKNGNFLFKSFSYYKTFEIFYILFLCSFLATIFIIPISFYIRNKRFFILKRYASFSRKRIIESNLFNFSIFSTISLLISILLYLLTIFIMNFYYNSCIGVINTIFFLTSWRSILISLLIFIGFIGISLLSILKLAPVNLEKMLTEVKEK